MRSFLLVLACGVFACSDAPSPPSVLTDTPFTLKVGETAVVDSTGMSVRFGRIAADGRCPIDVMCVWAGEALIDLDVLRPGMSPSTISLRILGYVTRENTAAHLPADTLGYRFTLMQLDPYPKHSGPPATGPKVALIKISPLTR